MGEMADMMIDGTLCEYCGVYLEPGETVYQEGDKKKSRMPKDGTGFGCPVICKNCHK